MALRGIDIASWQKGIDTKNVDADFVIIKRTQGTALCNPDFANQMSGCVNGGKLTGIYHYAAGGNPTAEADAFVSNIKPYIGKSLLALDWERVQNRKFNSGTDGAWVRVWLKRVIERTGVRPLVYVSASARNLVASAAADCNCGLWIAQYANFKPTGYQEKPWNEHAYQCVIRQYTSQGRVAGYGAALDLDKFYGDRAAWMKYARASGSAQPSAPAQPSRKSVDEIAREVIAGKWGNGADRVNSLKEAGYDPSAVQARVNEIVGAGKKKTVDQIAREVIAGKWGNDPQRSQKLRAAGYDPKAVQRRVNQLM